MTRTNEEAFERWKGQATGADIFTVAQELGAKLKRAGREHFGPCPACGGTDRFAINTTKRIFNCRGAVGGDVVQMVMHVLGVNFLAACEFITGEPPPKGKSQVDDNARAENERRRLQAEEDKRRSDREDEEYEDRQLAKAASIWNGRQPIAGSIAEKYLLSRGLIAEPDGWPDVFGFIPRLVYPYSDNEFPAFVARVDDMMGELTGIWRIYLDPKTGKKAPVENPKMGLGPVIGGACRIGGIGPRVGVTEGIETGAAVRLIERCRFPVWASLSTAGMSGLEVPIEIKRLPIYLDGDWQTRKKEGEYAPEELAAGRRAASALRVRMLEIGVDAPIQPEPEPWGTDYLDAWCSMKRLLDEVA